MEQGYNANREFGPYNRAASREGEQFGDATSRAYIPDLLATKVKEFGILRKRLDSQFKQLDDAERLLF